MFMVCFKKKIETQKSKMFECQMFLKYYFFLEKNLDKNY